MHPSKRDKEKGSSFSLKPSLRSSPTSPNCFGDQTQPRKPPSCNSHLAAFASPSLEQHVGREEERELEIGYVRGREGEGFWNGFWNGFCKDVGRGDRGCEMTILSPRKISIFDKTMSVSARFGHPRPCQGIQNVRATDPSGCLGRPHLRPLLFIRAPAGHFGRLKASMHQKFSFQVESPKVQIGCQRLRPLLCSGRSQDLPGVRN